MGQFSDLSPHEWSILEGLTQAAVAVVSGLSLPRTLQRITNITRDLVGAKYTALGVPAPDKTMRTFITSGLEPAVAKGIEHEPVGIGLLGALLDSDDVIRLRSLKDDPRSAGFCDHHPYMDSFLGVPIIGRNQQRLGNLYLCDKLNGELFNDADERLVKLLASYAAIAIENANLHNQLQEGALNTERDRIAMEIHDGVIQMIYAVGMKLEILRGKMTIQPEDDAQFLTVFDDLNRIIEDLRRYILNLRSTTQNQNTLKQHLRTLAQHFTDFSAVDVIMDVPDELPPLTDLQRHGILQIVRESFANVARHAEANHVKISIHATDRKLHIAVQDDGIGFDMEQAEQKGHFGLTNLHQRARSLDAALQIESLIGRGTTLYLVLPLKRDE